MITSPKDMRSITGRWLRTQMFEGGLAAQDLIDGLEKAGINVSRQYVSNIRNGGMSLCRANKIADAMGWKAPDFEADRNVAFVDPNIETNHQQHAFTLTSNRSHKWIGKNLGREKIARMDMQLDWVHSERPSMTDLSKLSLCAVIDQSMSGSLGSEDTLVTDSTVTKFESDDIYIFSYQDTLFIKRIQRLPGRGIKVISDDKERYEPYIIDEDTLHQIQVHARVIGKWTYTRL